MEVDWNIVAGQLMTEVLRIMIPVLTVLVVKWIVEIYKKVKETNPKIAELIAYAAQLGYAAAEDFFRGQKVCGDDKMDYAIDRAGEYLKSVGINVIDDVIRDSINAYGVNSYKFSWTQSPLDRLYDNVKMEREEEQDEPDASDDLRIGSDNDDHDADHNEAGEPAVRPDQTLAGEEAGERAADDDQDGQAGGPDGPDGEEAA